ncbi:MAG: ATP-binding cassette domain-containing protein [Planctomycetes bacterium]|nr:ATP-binding cassette domain-containing protein [Planctomycetota bacterium]
MLELQGITKTFGGFIALDKVDFDVRGGEVVGLLGENGAGKSTLLNIVSGVLAPDGGTMRWNGEQLHIHSPREATRRGIGVVHQHFMLVPGFTVAENIALHSPDKSTFYHADEWTQRVFLRLDGRERQQARHSVAVELGRLVGKLHAGGLLHRDLHAGNILVRMDDDGGVSLWLIDLHGLTARRRLSQRTCEKNLCELGFFFAERTTPADRLRFLEAWHATLREADGARRSGAGAVARARAADTAFRDTVRRIGRRFEGLLQSAHRRVDRKWRRDNRRLIRADRGRRRCRGLAELGRELLEAVRDDPAGVLRVNEGHLTTTSGSPPWQGGVGGGLQVERFVTGADPPWPPLSKGGKVDATLAFGGVRRPVIVVEFPPCQWFRGAFRQCPARRGWEMGHALLRRGIATPRPLVYVDAGRDGGPAFLVLERPDEAEPAADLLARQDCDNEARHEIERRALRAVLPLAADQLRRLHDAGFEHCSLSASSFLVAPCGSGWRIWFSGTEGVYFKGRLSVCRRLRALRELAGRIGTPSWLGKPPDAARPAQAGHYERGLTTADRLRFLKSYLGREFRAQWKNVWRRAAR